MTGGIHTVAAPTTPVTINGKTYEMGPLCVRDIAELSHSIRLQRLSALIEASKLIRGKPFSLEDAMSKNAVLDPTDADVARYISTYTGRAHCLWLRLKRIDDKLTQEEVQSAIENNADLFGLLQNEGLEVQKAVECPFAKTLGVTGHGNSAS